MPSPSTVRRMIREEIAQGLGISTDELAFINGVTAGTAASGKAVVLGSSGEIATITTATITAIVTGGITGVDSSLGVTGLAATAATGGAVVVTGGATTTSGVGGLVSYTGGAGAGTDAGGAASLVGGASGAGATGNGGASAVTGGAALSTNGTGGAGSLIGGVATGTGTGGAITITAGASAGAGGTAGSVTIDCGAPAGGTVGAINIGSAVTNKLGFFGVAAVVQQPKASFNNWAAATDVAGALAALGLVDSA